MYSLEEINMKQPENYNNQSTALFYVTKADYSFKFRHNKSEYKSQGILLYKRYLTMINT